MRVEFHPQTETDLNSAISYYNELRPGLGDALRLEAYATIDRILLNSRQYAIVERDIRRCFLHRFPYSVLFCRVNDELVRILAIRHHRRHPEFGLTRR